MRSATSMGSGGGSKYSPPRLPSACDTRSHTGEREARHCEIFLIFLLPIRYPGETLPSISGRPRLTRVTALCPSRVMRWPRDAVEVLIAPLCEARNIFRGRSSACRFPQKLWRTCRSHELCGRLVAVPVFTRRSAGSWLEFVMNFPDRLRRMEVPATVAPCSPRKLSSSSAVTQYQISRERRERRDCRESVPLICFYASKKG
jgi:hypothetical protein